MNRYLHGVDVLGGDAAADAAALAAAQRQKSQQAASSGGGMSWTSIAGLALAAVAGVVLWPHIKKWTD